MAENKAATDIVTLAGYPDLLNAKQVQQILGLGRSVVYALINSSEIKHNYSLLIPSNHV